MFRRLSLFAAALCISASASAVPLTIDFESFPGADGVLGTADDTPSFSSFMSPLRSEYASVGVNFTQGTLFQDGFYDGNENNHFISSTSPVASFLVPVYGISIESNSMWNATLNVFDALGNIIATSTLVNPTEGSAFYKGTVSVTTTERIYGFEVVPAIAGRILNLDNLVLDVAPADVPEPSAALLFPLALAGLAAARRRKKA